MDDRLDKLESVIESLAKSMTELEARIVRLEEGAGVEAVRLSLVAEGDRIDASLGGADTRTGFSPVMVLSIIGRTFLVLAGAFLLRALTDAEIFPQAAGVALGLAYSMAWIVFADRAGARGLTLSASFYGVAAVLIAYPMLWETTAKLEVLSPGMAAALITFTTGAAMLVSWRRGIHALAWSATIATLVTCPALMLATAAMEIFTVPILILGVVSLWIAYSRGWRIMRWIVAFVADACVLQMVYLATRFSDHPGRFGDLSAPAVQVLAVSLLMIYLGSFAVYNLALRGNVSPFEVLQSAASLVVGFGGAVYIARTTGTGDTLLGAAALIAAGACYAVAFAFVSRRLGRCIDFFFYAWLALVLTLTGSLLVIGGGGLPLCWMGLAVTAAVLGGYYDRITLRAHCAVYAAAAALHSGLIEESVKSFTAAVARTWPALVVVMLVLTVVCYVLLVATQRGRKVRWPGRLPRFTVLLLSVTGAGGLAVVALTRLLSDDASEAGPASMAIARTTVLAGAAFALAAVGARGKMAEMCWLVYPVLLAGGIKLLLEDMRQGRPITIFLGFVVYGIALITAPRLLRAGPKREEQGNSTVNARHDRP
jgi:hypothetical protein